MGFLTDQMARGNTTLAGTKAPEGFLSRTMRKESFSSAELRQIKARSKGVDTGTSEGLGRVAEIAGLEPPKKRRLFNALGALGRVLNFPIATLSGAARGAIRPDINVFQGVAEGVKKNLSFGDVLREDFGVGTKSISDVFPDAFSVTGEGLKLQKKGIFDITGAGAMGLVADILLDPITYLSFGTSAGLKMGGKTLSREGTKLVIEASREIVEKGGQAGKIAKGKFIGQMAEGAKDTLDTIAERAFITDLVGRATGKNAVKAEVWGEFAEKARELGITRNTFGRFIKLGEKGLIDPGGIKFARMSLITGEHIANSPVGKFAAMVKTSPIGQVIGKVKQPLGKLFVPGFGKNKVLSEMFDKMNISQRRAVKEILDYNNTLFQGLSKGQLDTFFNTVMSKKIEVAEVRSGASSLDTGVAGKIVRRFKQSQRGERLLFDDKKLQDISDAMFEGRVVNGVRQEPVVSTFARISGLPEEEAIKFYMPSIHLDGLRFNESYMARMLTNPESGFLKQFKGAQEGLITNPWEAYTRGQVAIVRARLKTDLIDNVATTFGKVFGSLDEATTSGFKPFERTTLNGRIKTYLPNEIHDDIVEYFSRDVKTLDELARVSGVDFMTRLFKSYVTSLFPGFHVRNITSNQFQNMLILGSGVTNIAIQKDALKIAVASVSKEGKALQALQEELITKAGVKISLDDIMEAAKKRGLIDEGAFTRDLETVFSQGQEELKQKSKLARFNPFDVEEFAPIKTGRMVGNVAEAQAKLVGFITGILDGQTFDEAAKMANDAIFSYGKLTEFERSVMRRVIPFYTFSRKNIELQFKALTRTPGRVSGQLKVLRGLGQPFSEEEKQGLPGYVLEGSGIKAGTDKFGRPQFVTSLGLPLEEALSRFSGDNGISANVVQDVASQMNPIIKYPIERALNVDFFRKRPISDINSANDIGGVVGILRRNNLGGIGDQLADMVDLSKVTKNKYANGEVVGTREAWTADPKKLHFLRNMFTGRIQSTIGQFVSPEVSPPDALLRLMTGIRKVSIDPEEQEFFRELDRKKELTDFLKRKGVISVFEKSYIPER